MEEMLDLDAPPSRNRAGCAGDLSVAEVPVDEPVHVVPVIGR
jgi:hypothetical protein